MIDWQRITTLRDEIGADDFDEVVELFLAEMDETLDRLPQVNDSELEGILHLLKGSALNLGFQSFADLCSNYEADARAGNSATIDRSAVRRLYDESRGAFMQQSTA